MFIQWYRQSKHVNEADDDIALVSFIDSRNDDGYLDIEVTLDIIYQILLKYEKLNRKVL